VYTAFNTVRYVRYRTESHSPSTNPSFLAGIQHFPPNTALVIIGDNPREFQILKLGFADTGERKTIMQVDIPTLLLIAKP
jgi:hypothetical protein